MATTVYKTKEIELENGTTILGKPLKIAALRRFMKEFAKLDEAKDNDATFDIFSELVLISLDQWDKKLADKEYIENNMDLENYHEIIEAASGIDLRSQGNE